MNKLYLSCTSIVYRQDMPESLPPILFVKQLQKRLTFALNMAARAILVVCVWLIVLPYFTVWIWRFYFWSGENLSTQLTRFQKLRNHTVTASVVANISTTVTSSITEYATDSVSDIKPESSNIGSTATNYPWIDTLRTSFSIK